MTSEQQKINKSEAFMCEVNNKCCIMTISLFVDVHVPLSYNLTKLVLTFHPVQLKSA